MSAKLLPFPQTREVVGPEPRPTSSGDQDAGVLIPRWDWAMAWARRNLDLEEVVWEQGTKDHAAAVRYDQAVFEYQDAQMTQANIRTFQKQAEKARRETQQLATADTVATITPDSVATPSLQPRPAEVSRLFESVLRLEGSAMPHPLWRLACLFERGLNRFFAGLRVALLAYYTLLGLAAFPLIADGHYVAGAAMAFVGIFFAWLLSTIFRIERPAFWPNGARRQHEQGR